MNKDQVKGSVENLKGRVKQAVGAVTGNKSQEAGGMVDRVKGAVRGKVGDVKEDARDAEARARMKTAGTTDDEVVVDPDEDELTNETAPPKR